MDISVSWYYPDSVQHKNFLVWPCEVLDPCTDVSITPILWIHSMNLLLFRFIAIVGTATVLHLASSGTLSCGQELSQRQASNLTIDAIFKSKEFSGETFVGQWQSDSQGFERIKRDAESGDVSIVRIDLTSPSKENVVVSSEMLTPDGADKPLSYGLVPMVS